MPYIITTHELDETSGMPGPPMDRPRAVATLDEARDIITGLFPFPEHGHKLQERVGSDLSAMTADGGTVGPLPDGTMIEVTPIDLYDLAIAAGYPPANAVHASINPPQILDAYNAQVTA